MNKTLKIIDHNLIQITPAGFEEVFNDTLSPYVKSKIPKYGFKYCKCSDRERDDIIKKIIMVLLNQDVVTAGDHRIDQWEDGWNVNLKKIQAHSGKEEIVPGYFGKYDFLRWKQNFIRPISDMFEYNMLAIIQDWLFDKYMRSASAVYEFGCGTGHNLFRVRDVNPQTEIWGLDWTRASVKIINKLSEQGFDSKLHGRLFDLCRPDDSFYLKPKSIVYTVAALEQIGNDYEQFLAYLLNQKPELCIHIEPIEELLDEQNLLDFLSIQYFHKRKYLSGYLVRLKELEKQGILKIHREQRTYIGSMFIEGYSVVVWSPC